MTARSVVSWGAMDEKVLKLIVAIVAQVYEYITNCTILVDELYGM